jgi:hypothetical protein
MVHDGEKVRVREPTERHVARLCVCWFHTCRHTIPVEPITHNAKSAPEQAVPSNTKEQAVPSNTKRLEAEPSSRTRSSSLSVWTQFTGVNWYKKNGHPKGMPLGTRMLAGSILASSEQAWEPMAPSSVNFCRTRAPCQIGEDCFIGVRLQWCGRATEKETVREGVLTAQCDSILCMLVSNLQQVQETRASILAHKQMLIMKPKPCTSRGVSGSADVGPAGCVRLTRSSNTGAACWIMARISWSVISNKGISEIASSRSFSRSPL